MSNEMPRQVPCPTCKKPGLLSRENPFRPFCCHRCKLIDLGAWADGSYSIPSTDSPSVEEMDHSNDDKYGG